VQDNQRSGQGQMQIWIEYERTVNQQLFGSADKVMGICLEENTRTPS
jgi:hypothetical protein